MFSIGSDWLATEVPFIDKPTSLWRKGTGAGQDSNDEAISRLTKVFDCIETHIDDKV